MIARQPDVFGTAPVWRNQDLVLHHGTVIPFAETIRQGSISIVQGNANKDFGRGFYTTTVFDQAARWARRIRLQRRLSHPPAVVTLTVSRAELALLASMAFTLGERTAEDFWSFVRHCRSPVAFHRSTTFAGGSYDMVSGPLVASWEYRLLFPGCDQISFHTQRAEDLLNSKARKQMIVLNE